MTRFAIETAEGPSLIYDSTNSLLLWGDGTPVDLPIAGASAPARYRDSIPVSKTSPGRKVRAVRSLKIQLGLLCNYECSYCSQRFVPRADSTNPHDVPNFMAQLEAWFDGGTDGQGEGVRVEFWGGEPLAYWKTLKPLAEAVRMRYPRAELWMATNGSLLDQDKNAWLDELGFGVSVSHDGPGQHVRGPDPLDNAEQRAAILDLYARLAPKRRMSFNAMLHRDNTSRAALVDFFVTLTGDPDVKLGEGALIDAYDEGGAASALSGDEHGKFRTQAFMELLEGRVGPKNSLILDGKVTSFVRSLITRRPMSALGQKCGMDKPDSLAIDLKGNALTCQNVSTVSTAPNGQPHHIGSVTDIEGVRLTTATSWHSRRDCPSCPVIHLCGGACMFLEGDLWRATCDNAFTDNVVFFAWAIKLITGLTTIKILGGRADREDIWNPPAQGKRIIPIKAA